MEHYPKGVLHSLLVHSKKFLFYSAGTKCTLYCDHKPLTPFITTGMSSPVLNWLGFGAAESLTSSLNTSQARQNVVADTISRLRILGLYQDNGNNDIATTDYNMVENIIEEAHAIEWVPNSASYNMEKLILDALREKQWQDTFCIKKVKSPESKTG